MCIYIYIYTHRMIKVFVHLTTVLQSSDAQRLFDHPVYMIQLLSQRKHSDLSL